MNGGPTGSEWGGQSLVVVKWGYRSLVVVNGGPSGSEWGSPGPVASGSDWGSQPLGLGEPFYFESQHHHLYWL